MPSTKEIQKRLQKRLMVFNKFNGKCAYCGCELNMNENFQIDHVAPKKRYKVYGGDCYDPKWEYGEGSGSDELDNLFPCCKSCNCCKNDLTIEQFRYRIEDRLVRLNSLSSEYQIAKRFGLVREIKKEGIVFYFEKFMNG